MIDNKKEGIWEAWFKDGVKKFTINYHKGFPDYDLKNRELPYVLVEDSLKPGCESRIKMINFYLEESLLPLSDVIFKDSPNNDYYTYTIIPQDNEPLLFLYETLEEIHIDTLCETNFYRVGITQEELKYTKFYRSDFVELEIINNY
jgi:hypothetical protein